ncbi:hypothetical protein A3Q56_03515 [Intoshia linei]|uniref:Protein kinase domain-containing protein n=1 Tax=Intoshia linei TaxID=1819745 RepID=A0A177B383_9BILA|nr:hypothetical protein A3Q56_03515 [Intoshia linei]
MNASKDNEYPDYIFENYRLIRKIGSGSFGVIFLAIHRETKEEVAIKLESVNNRHLQLIYESRIYRYLQGGCGFPRIKCYERQGKYNAMVMELLGPSLEDLFNFCSRRFTMKTVLMLGDQMIARIEFMHHKYFMQVYIIDFGLSKKYKDNSTGEHIPYRSDKSLTGTARYASINSHLGVEQSRRDDLESLGYVFMYFSRGSLPWQGLKANTKKQKYDRICEKKCATTIETLCKGFPVEYPMYLNYCRELNFKDNPDYLYLRQMFRFLFKTYNHDNDFLYDWTILKQREKTDAKGKN